MDTATHLVAGALTPLAFTNAPKTKMLVLFGIVCGEFPDIDILAGKGAEAMLSFHRGITHALVLQPVFALILALLFHKLIKKGDGGGTWTFGKTWSVALLALCIHLFLDCMTTFGTQIFLPFSDFRVALPAMYIIDLVLTLPLFAAWGVIIRRGGVCAPEAARKRPARKALAWLMAYPLLCLGIHAAATASLEKAYAAPGNPLGATRVALFPEPFAPLNWKIVCVSPGAYHMGQFLAFRVAKDPARHRYERVSPELWDALRRENELFAMFAQFASHPFQTVARNNDETVWTFGDMRYETTLPALIKALGREDGIFLMQAKAENGGLAAYRFLYRGKDSDTEPWLPFAPKSAAVKRETPHAG